jgi:hypothetical protein
VPEGGGYGGPPPDACWRRSCIWCYAPGGAPISSPRGTLHTLSSRRSQRVIPSRRSTACTQRAVGTGLRLGQRFGTAARALDPGAPLQLHRAHLRRDPPPGQGDRAPARRALLHLAGVGGARSRLRRVARVHHDPRLHSGYCRICAAACMIHSPNSRNGIRHNTPKPAWRQPIPQPSHRITNASARSLRQATFTPLPGRHLSRNPAGRWSWSA